MPRETLEVNTDEAPRQPPKPPSEAAVRIFGWLVYTIIMLGFSWPFYTGFDFKHIGLACILGSFAQQLNTIANTLKNRL